MIEQAAVAPSYAPGPAGQAFLRLLARLPLRFAVAAGTAFGWLVYLLDRKRRRIVVRNLQLCFPGLRPRARRRLARRNLTALGRSLFCAIALGESADRSRVERQVRVRGREHIERAAADGRPVILFAPHFVGLELGWLRLSSERRMVAMYREPRRHLLHWALHRNRTRFLGLLVERETSMRSVVRQLERGLPFYYLPDVDPGSVGAYVFVPFFDIPAATVTTLSRLARLTRALVLPCVTREVGSARYEVTLHAPLAGFPTDDPEADARRVNQWIETEVRPTPEQYLWVHRRFKTRPHGAPSPYG